ncbi:MAG: hypothetical protein KBD78_04490 [Oligoflexales bacterium]|nr:hypothetical protein [Oligoflexales bacterium]
MIYRAYFYFVFIFCLSKQLAADQCQIIDNTVAESAIALIKVGAEVIDYCEPCSIGNEGNTLNKYQVKKIEVKDFKIDIGNIRKEIFINNAPVDLAYLFIQTKHNSQLFENVSNLVNCISVGVSQFIKVDENGTLIEKAVDISGIFSSPYAEWKVEKKSPISFNLELTFKSSENFNSIGQMKSTGNSDGIEVKFLTPVSNCFLLLKKIGNNLHVNTTAKCGALDRLKAVYQRN